MTPLRHLVLPVVLLGVAQDPVAEAADVAEGGVALVAQLLQTEHGAVATVSEGCLQQLEDLQTKQARGACVIVMVAHCCNLDSIAD